MNIKYITITFFFTFFSLAAMASDSGGYIDKPTEKASELVKKYVISGDSDKPSILNNLTKLADSNPENINVIRIYTSLLSSERMYKKAISYLEPINKSKTTSSLLLQECMLKDRINKTDLSCYKKVVFLSEKNGTENMDYLMALFFSDDEKFEKKKNTLIKNNHSLENNFSIFSYDKKSVLQSIYP
ncbi:hypothetical protein HC231_08175 [Brenneria izadpanahii]|uniref:Uncharacterized protein n=1 Tax=Brenneria izadpanahii TaxID=2722756 RepID=A0ABX7UUN0_9GAMM|nr:hypothetical protein [Brenneria izadpanahii]QTF07910.1 hypothetical protein HC231_08175 [Brenneria izadpanahii]